MYVTEKHTLETLSDNFLGADKSLGDPQTPLSSRHQATEERAQPNTWRWLQQAHLEERML